MEYQRDGQPGSWQLTIRWPSLLESLADWQSHGFQDTMTLPGWVSVQHYCETELDGIPVVISRTGWTGGTHGGGTSR